MVLRLREVRERRLMTQEELATQSGITQTQISALELGKHQPRFSTIKRLAAALGVDPQELIAPPDTTQPTEADR